MKDIHSPQRFACTYTVSCAVVLCILWPLGAVVINALTFLGWAALQLVTFLSRWKPRADAEAPFTIRRCGELKTSCPLHPFVSVHLPIHNEPPDVVRGTLNALAKLQYPAVEIIVIDNNTRDPTLWRPVERHCKTLGSRFRFVHRSNVDGAKAGALEITRGIMDERTTHVAVVDADYQVASDFLNVALTALEESGAHFVQFPQAYRDVTDEQQSVEAELRDYFDRHAIAADRYGHMLLTGTLSVLSIRALEAVGGWPTQTITEDAELGMSLRRNSFHGVYVPRVAGRGLLPPNVKELKSQRHRWIVGNLQTLIRNLRHCIADRKLHTSVAHWAQLSAWCSFVTIPVVMLLAGVFLSVAEMSDPSRWYQISSIASATILGQLFVTLLISQGSLEFLFVRWSLPLSSGWATLTGLTMQRIRFRCTKRNNCAGARISIAQLLVPMILAAGALCALALSWFVPAVVLFLCTFTSATSSLLDRKLRARSTIRRIDQHQEKSTSHG